MIVTKLDYAEVWEGNAKSVKQLETVRMTAAKNVLPRIRMLKYDEQYSIVEWPRYIEKGRKVRCWLGEQLLFFWGDFSCINP